MSHFALKVGDFLHFHPFAHPHIDATTTRQKITAVGPVFRRESSPSSFAPSRSTRRAIGPALRREPSRPKDLAFFGLCETETGHREDGRAELDRFALVREGDDRLYEQDELWLSLM